MALPIHIQGRYWGIAALLFFVALWFLGSVMLPFLVAGAVAYVGAASGATAAPSTTSGRLPSVPGAGAGT